MASNTFPDLAPKNDAKVKTFEELESDAKTLSQSMLNHQANVTARREIDLDHVRKVLRFYQVRLDEIADSLHNESKASGESNGGDYWSKR